MSYDISIFLAEAHAHSENDEPLFKSIYKDEKALNRTKISIDNWRDAQDVWYRRFKEG